MSVRMKLTHSKTASRRAHHRAGVPRLVTTPSGVRRRHFADPETGMYRGKQIIAVGGATEKAAPTKEGKKAGAPQSKAPEQKSAKNKEEDAQKGSTQKKK